MIDEAHPDRELAEEMSEVLKEWLDRRRLTDLRDRIGRRTENERVEEQQQEALDIMADGDDRRLVTREERAWTRTMRRLWSAWSERRMEREGLPGESVRRERG